MNILNRFMVLQLIGWSLFIVFNLASRHYFVHFHVTELVNSLVIGLSLFLVTSILRNYYKRVFDLSSIGKCLGYIFLGSIVGSLTAVVMYSIAIIPNQEYLFGSKFDDITIQILTGIPTILFLLIMWSVVYLVFKKQAALKHAKNEQIKLSNSLKEARLDILLSQLNPHFLFNAINNIRALTLEDNAKARDMLTTLSEVMRYTMQIEKAAEIPLKEELEIIEHYIALNKLQFEEKLEVKLDIDPLSKTLCLPPMILQLLIENAIKHGISKQKEGGIIHISTAVTKSEWLLNIENTGSIKTATDAELHVGLNNIRQRLAINYGDDASFSLEPSKIGVLAQIKLPLKD